MSEHNICCAAGSAQTSGGYQPALIGPHSDGYRNYFLLVNLILVAVLIGLGMPDICA
jgi:hypothetical protein